MNMLTRVKPRGYPIDGVDRLGIRLSRIGVSTYRHRRSRRWWPWREYSLILFIGGESRLTSETGGEFPIRPGTVCLHFPGERLSREPRPGDPLSHYWVVFSGWYPEKLEKEGELARSCPARQLSEGDAVRLVRVFEEALQAAAQGAFARICGRLPEMLEIFTARTESRLSSDPLVEAACQRLEADLSTVHDYATLAGELGVGYSTLRRRFVRGMGCSLHRHLLRKRIDRACDLLLSGMGSAEVGRAVGMPDPAHFSRTFRSMTGCSPREFMHP